jgi:hypothetical protein
MVFSKWKGRNYVRSHTNPAQPRTGSQVGVRAMFKFLSKCWTAMSALNKASWDTLAKQMNVSAFNAFQSVNQKRWRNFLTPSKNSAIANAATAPSAPTLTATAAVRQITIAATHGTNAPDFGYTIFRSLTTGFTSAFSNCVQVVGVDGAGDGSWVDTPLDPGTYYYKAVPFMADGKVGTTSTQATATVA